jgi:catechol-2,3-dioxygenase
LTNHDGKISSHGAVPRPAYMAHFVIRTLKYEESVQWYTTFFDAHVVFANEMVTFLSFDDEHHRIAIGRLPDLEPYAEKGAGVDHLAFSYRSLGDLVLTYDRLKLEGILPYWAINHGPTTSLYYRDPDGVQIEMQTDNIAAEGGAKAVFGSEAFAENFIGVEFDPDALSSKYHAGEDPLELLQQGAVPPVEA